MGTEIIMILHKTLENPWTLLFVAIWGLGWFLKEKTLLDTQKTPWVLLSFGIILGLMLIESSVGGGIVGGVMALAQMGAYDVVKPLLSRKEHTDLYR